MKWIRMIGLYFERTFEYRLRSFVWLLIPIVNNFTLILFWNGAGLGSKEISSYYILMTIVGLITTSHVEYEVSQIDIKQGQLVNYLTKPISYPLTQLLSEIPYRILHGIYAILLISIFLYFFPGLLSIQLSFVQIPLVTLIIILGYLVSFFFKLSIAYVAFWFTDTTGFFELTIILLVILSGGIMPIPWYPPFLQTICNILPFAYSGYYPVAAVQGVIPLSELFSILGIQCVWLIILMYIHNTLWSNGIKKFSAVGQ